MSGRLHQLAGALNRRGRILGLSADKTNREPIAEDDKDTLTWRCQESVISIDEEFKRIGCQVHFPISAIKENGVTKRDDRNCRRLLGCGRRAGGNEPEESQRP